MTVLAYKGKVKADWWYVLASGVAAYINTRGGMCEDHMGRSSYARLAAKYKGDVFAVDGYVPMW